MEDKLEGFISSSVLELKAWIWSLSIAPPVARFVLFLSHFYSQDDQQRPTANGLRQVLNSEKVKAYVETEWIPKYCRL